MQIKDLSIFHNLDDAEFKKSLVCTQSVIHEYKKNDYGRCEKNCSHHSKVVFNMLELFAKRTDENNQQLEVLTSGNLKQRIATYLLEHADNNNLVSLSMNREELALYLNTTRPSLSRTLLSLQEDGFIHLSSRKSIKILDAEALLYIE